MALNGFKFLSLANLPQFSLIFLLSVLPVVSELFPLNLISTRNKTNWQRKVNKLWNTTLTELYSVICGSVFGYENYSAGYVFQDQD